MTLKEQAEKAYKKQCKDKETLYFSEWSSDRVFVIGYMLGHNAGLDRAKSELQKYLDLEKKHT